MKKTTQFFFDKFAIGLSALCAIHCLALPVLVLAFPTLLAAFQVDDHFFHEVLVWLVIPSSSIAVFLGCKHHKNLVVLVLAIIGMTGLVATAVFGHDALGETGEKVATLFSVSLLAYAHWRNYSLCRKGTCDHS